MIFSKNIKLRLTMWYTVIFGVLLAILSLVVYFTLSDSLHRSLDNSLKQRSVELENHQHILEDIAEGSFKGELGEVVSLYFYSGNRLTEASASSVDIVHSSQLIEKAIAGQDSFVTTTATNGQELRLYGVPFQGDPDLNAALVVGYSTDTIEESLVGLRRILFIVIPIAMVLAAGGGFFLANRALKPVEQISKTAQEIEASDLSRRINIDSKDEVGTLASTLNQMISRLESAFKRQAEFTANASHELRTPLTVIEAESTLAMQEERSKTDYKKSFSWISREAKFLVRILDKLLNLARSDAQIEQLVFRKVSLRRLLSEVLEDTQILYQKKGLHFNFSRMDNLIVRGDSVALKTMFLNLYENACRYTPNGGSITTSVFCEDKVATVTITDTGIGIPPEHIPHIFERFYRVDKARSRTEWGSGLGLAISKHIAEAHGGRIEVESEVGKGSTFSVSLPLQD